MTLARMLAVCRLISGETDNTNTYWTDAEIYALINDAQRLVAEEYPVNLTFKTYSIASGEYKIALEDDFLQLKDVELEENVSAAWIKKLYRLSLDEYSNISDGNPAMTGEPAWYKLEFGAVTNLNASQLPGDIWLYPRADATYKVRVRFYQAPTDFATDGSDDAKVSELPLSMHMAVCYYTAMLMAMKDGNQKKIQNFNTLYQQKMRSSMKMLNRVDRTGRFTARDEAGYSRTGIMTRRIRRGPLS